MLEFKGKQKTGWILREEDMLFGVKYKEGDILTVIRGFFRHYDVFVE